MVSCFSAAATKERLTADKKSLQTQLDDVSAKLSSKSSELDQLKTAVRLAGN